MSFSFFFFGCVFLYIVCVSLFQFTLNSNFPEMPVQRLSKYSACKASVCSLFVLHEYSVIDGHEKRLRL